LRAHGANVGADRGVHRHASVGIGGDARVDWRREIQVKIQVGNDVEQRHGFAIRQIGRLLRLQFLV
jgi:hypothetical protein